MAIARALLMDPDILLLDEVIDLFIHEGRSSERPRRETEGSGHATFEKHFE